MHLLDQDCTGRWIIAFAKVTANWRKNFALYSILMPISMFALTVSYLFMSSRRENMRSVFAFCTSFAWCEFMSKWVIHQKWWLDIKNHGFESRMERNLWMEVIHSSNQWISFFVCIRKTNLASEVGFTCEPNLYFWIQMFGFILWDVK